jgi:RIO kinase 1
VAGRDGLSVLLEDGVIDEVHGRLMSGKEASVYVVGYRGEVVAAKVYKARERRTFKATASYTEGRNQTRSTRDKRAMAKRSSYGRELIEESWREMEYRALFDAFHGGVRVPKPIMMYEDVLLMDLVRDESGEPAKRLADFELSAEHAEPMLREIHRQTRLLLATGRIHGDLSAFNVLMAHDGPTIIDLPQVVDAAGNQQAREILRRDLRNIAEHLARYDARLLRFRDAGDGLWHHYLRGTLDQATEPQAGSVRSDRAGGAGRRAALAERGRMGRGDGGRPGDPGRSGPRPDQGERRGAPHDPHGGPVRHDRGAPHPRGGHPPGEQRAGGGRPPPQQHADRRGGPPPHARDGARAQHGDRRGSLPDARDGARGQHGDRRGPPPDARDGARSQQDRRGPPPDPRNGARSQHGQRGGPPPDARDGGRTQRDDRRGPSRDPHPGAPPRDDGRGSRSGARDHGRAAPPDGARSADGSRAPHGPRSADVPHPGPRGRHDRAAAPIVEVVRRRPR